MDPQKCLTSSVFLGIISQVQCWPGFLPFLGWPSSASTSGVTDPGPFGPRGALVFAVTPNLTDLSSEPFKEHTSPGFLDLNWDLKRNQRTLGPGP